MRDINDELLEAFGEWDKNILRKFAETKDEGTLHNYSAPFVTGVAVHELTKKNILYIGQEARDLWRYKEKTLKEVQSEYSLRYIDAQIDATNNNKHNPYKKSASPFWEFYRSFPETHFLIWTNIDKLHGYNSNKKTIRLSLEERLQLNKQYGIENNTILQNEIEIIAPSAIIFVTGPRYYESMANAFGIDKNILYEYRPTSINPVNEVGNILALKQKAFWTYHPKYLRLSGKFDTVIESILEQL